MLTLNGYRVPKGEDAQAAETIRKALTVKPYIPSVFVTNPNSVPKYKVYKEVEDAFYLPKHYGIGAYGPPAQTTRDVAQTDEKYWEFVGSIRPAQEAVVNSFLLPQPHDGIISLHTGGGKTVCGLYIASRLRLPTLVIVHNSFLRDQWYERVRTFLPNARIGRIQGDVCEVEGFDVVIAMLQTLSMRDIPIASFKSLGLVIVDECHHIASEVFVQALPKVTSKYMLGLSATPSRKDGLMPVAHWFLGPLIYQSLACDSSDPSIQVEYYEYQNNDPNFNRGPNLSATGRTWSKLNNRYTISS